MKVTEHLKAAKKPIISFEILPPAKGKSIENLFGYLNDFMEFQPAYVNVTYHRAEEVFKRRDNGHYDKVEVRKRPGTVGICAAIMHRYNVDAVPHLICGGFTKEETENALIDLAYLGINNVLALRGDAAANEKTFEPTVGGHRYASELVEQIVDLNNGVYLEKDILDGSSTNFCIGVAGYPEKHFEAPNMKSDIKYLKHKVNLGADYIMTQMFFDNKHFYNYEKACKDTGIDIPILPGLKPATSRKHINMIPGTFNVELPEDLASALSQTKSDAASDSVGEEWLLAQCRDLLANGVPALHFYTQGKAKVVLNVLRKLF